MIGSWSNSILYVLEWMEAYRYLKNSPKGSILSKLTVAAALSVDTLSVAANYAGVYLYCVTHWGTLDYMLVANWTLFLYVITTGVTAFITQSSLVFRFFRTTRQYIISVLLQLTAMASLVGCIITFITLIMFPTDADRGRLVVPVTLWLVAATCVDVAITLTLIWQLRGITPAFEKSRTLIERICHGSLQTGTLTTIVAALVLVTYLTDHASNVSVMFGYCLGRCYTLTLLSNLNLDSRLTRGTDGTDASAPPRTHGHGGVHAQSHHNHTVNNTESLGNIHVHRTAIVRIADGDSKYNSDADRQSERMHKDVF
ncbi:hypothetical protein FB45DRAFT_1022726 [Roridomyces roridus]|uniref:DUF6534 domain-containing protein n=1 Tax=Roridomyces roridus TaxID=1738132 RepID=A0AAD7CAP7_9AGAR|nr:hypothetical protein FB45DRAFT_1022726 [Roridomyces roridus]